MTDTSDIPSLPDRRRKQTIMSQGHPEFHDTALDNGTVHSNEPEIQAAHTSEDNVVNDDVFEEKQQYKADTHSNENNSILETDNTETNDKSAVGHCNSDVSDIVYDDTKPKRLAQPRTLKLDLENPSSHALRESISVLISPDEPETGSPTRRRHKQLLSVKSEPVIVSHSLPIETDVIHNRGPERRSRLETVADNKTIQTVKRPRYEQSPERARRKVSSPVQRLMVKNSQSAAAAAANSKDRKSSSDARLVEGRDRTYIYMPPRRKISSDARLEHRLIEEQLILPAKQMPKRKVSFDTTALINGNRVMPLNDEFIVREEPEPFIEVIKYGSNELEHFSSSSHNSKRSPPRVILTTDEDEWLETTDNVMTANENNSEFNEKCEVDYALGCDNRAYDHDDEEHERSISAVGCTVNGARLKRLSPLSDQIYSKIDEQAAIINTNFEEINNLTASKKVSSCSLPSNIGRRASFSDYQSPRKSILKKREDAESIASEDSCVGKSINVRKDSIALFMDQNGSVALQDVGEQYSQRIRCFGKDDIKQVNY